MNLAICDRMKDSSSVSLVEYIFNLVGDVQFNETKCLDQVQLKMYVNCWLFSNKSLGVHCHADVVLCIDRRDKNND